MWVTKVQQQEVVKFLWLFLDSALLVHSRKWPMQLSLRRHSKQTRDSVLQCFDSWRELHFLLPGRDSAFLAYEAYRKIQEVT